jgi:hypothetical protein
MGPPIFPGLSKMEQRASRNTTLDLGRRRFLGPLHDRLHYRWHQRIQGLTDLFDPEWPN